MGYWEKRLERREADMNKRMQKIEKELSKVYQQAINNIDKDIQACMNYQTMEISKLDEAEGINFYHKFKTHQLDPIDARTYREQANALIEKWLKAGNVVDSDMIMIQMRELRGRQSLTLLEAMKYSIQMHMNDYSVEMDKAMKHFLTDEAVKSYVYTHYEASCRAGFFSPITINKNAIEDLILTPFAGADFSTRIWQNNDTMVKKLQSSLNDIIVRGKGIKPMIKEFKDFLNPSYVGADGKIAKVGQGNIKRLLQTESSRIWNDSRQKGLKERGQEYYKILTINDSKRCDKCEKEGKRLNAMNDGKGIPIEERYLPFHVNCRCSIISQYYDRDETYNKEEMMFAYNGQLYTKEQYDKIKKDIPNKSLVKRVYKEQLEDPSYKKWKEKYVKVDIELDIDFGAM